jgi:hypothetical protein
MYHIKYNKYTQKLKQYDGSNIINDDCNNPDVIRVLQHPQTKKIIILLGETHSSIKLKTKKINYHKHFDRINSEKGIDLILGQISKRISKAQNNVEDTFHKVLLLIENTPKEILLGGSNLDYDPDLFEDLSNTSSLDYVNNKFYYLSKKYKNVLNRSIDIRFTLHIVRSITNNFNKYFKDIQLSANNYSDKKKLYEIINRFFLESMINIKKYIIDDKEFINPLSIPPFKSDENKQFFGKNYNNKIESIPRKLSKVFITPLDI